MISEISTFYCLDESVSAKTDKNSKQDRDCDMVKDSEKDKKDVEVDIPVTLNDGAKQEADDVAQEEAPSDHEHISTSARYIFCYTLVCL